MEPQEQESESSSPRMESDEVLVVTSDTGISSDDAQRSDREEDSWPISHDPPTQELPEFRHPRKNSITERILHRQNGTRDLLAKASTRPRGHKGKYWCFTENDPTGIVEMMGWFEQKEWPSGCEYVAAQVEAGESGTTHMQGYLELTNRKELTWLKNKVSATAHWERRRGTQKEAIDYCQKDDSRITGPYEWGTKTENTPGRRNDLIEMKMELDKGTTVAALAKTDAGFASCALYYKFFDWYSKNAGLKNPPRTKENTVEVILLIGEAGTGKTRYAMEHYPDAYWKPSQSKWWDGYQGESAVIFDDLNHGWFTWDTFMRIIDRYPLKVEYKGGYVDYCATTMVITSNTHPRYWYKNMGCRWPALARRISKVLHFSGINEEPSLFSLDDLFLYGEPTPEFRTNS